MGIQVRVARKIVKGRDASIPKDPRHPFPPPHRGNTFAAWFDVVDYFLSTRLFDIRNARRSFPDLRWQTNTKETPSTMKNALFSSSSRSTGRGTTLPDTPSQSSTDRLEQEVSSDTQRPQASRRYDKRQHGISKQVKVAPMLSKPHTRPENEGETPSHPNQQLDDEEPQTEITRKVTQKKRSTTGKTRLSGKKALRSTLRVTKKTASHLVHIASRSLTSDSSMREMKSTSRAVSAQSARSETEQRTSQRPSQSLSPFSRDITAVLERIQAQSTPTARSNISPEDAWKYLLLVPSSPFWVLWNLLHLLALGYICTVVPYVTALPSLAIEKRGDWSETTNRAIDLFYILDVIVNFRACFIDSETGDVVTDARRVATHYMRSSTVWFVFDIVMAFPFDLLLANQAVGSTMTFTFVRILRLVRLAKLLRILKLRPILDYCEDNLGVSRNKLIVVQLVATIAFVAHLTACGFILAATVGPSVVAASSSNRPWIEVYGLNDAPAAEIYVAALYWAFTMMTTVGFGDIVPVTLSERVYSILAMVISAGTYAYVIASMSTIVALMNLQQSRYYERINELNAYMASRQLPQGLQLRTRQFFRYYLTKKSVFDEHALFDVLPPNLREELVEHHVKTAMHHIHFFHELTERGFIGHIALFLRPVFFPPASLIVRTRDHAADMYFISKGACEVKGGAVMENSPARKKPRSPTKTISQFLNPRQGSAATVEGDGNGDIIVTVLRDGEFFGEMALLCDATRHRRFASVKSLTYCELYSLSYSHLGPAIDKFLTVRNQLHQTAQSRLVELETLQKNRWDIVAPQESNANYS